MVSGVAQVAVLGAQKFAVRVQMDPFKLASRSIGLNEIETALKNWNVNPDLPENAFTLQPPPEAQVITLKERRTGAL